MARSQRRKSKSKFSLADALDTSLETLVIFVLVFTPLAFGTVQPWSKFLFVATVGVLGLLGLIRCLVREKDNTIAPGFSVELLFGLAFCCLLVFQLLPLPQGLVQFFSPNTPALIAHAMAGESVPDFITLSLYPLATLRDLSIASALCMFFWVIITHFNTADKSRRIMLIAASVGGLIALIALIHQLLGLKELFGALPLRGGVTNGGVFVNSNNFGQFAILTLGITAGISIYQIRRVWGLQKSQKKQPSDDVLLKLRNQKLLLFVLCIGGLLLVCSIVGSTSRAAVIGLVLAALTLGVLQINRMPTRSVFAAWVTGLLVVVFLLSLTTIESIFDQITDVESAFIAFSHRAKVADDLTQVFLQFKFFGIGQGTHAVVYPYFQSFQSDKFIEYGDLDYFQFIAENGVAGLALLLTLMGVVVWRTYKTLKAKNHRLQIAAIGMAAGLLGVAVVSMSDFGQRFPGVSVFTALSVALIVNLSRLRNERKDADESESSSDFLPATSDDKQDPSVASQESSGRQAPKLALVAVLVLGSCVSVWFSFCDMRAAYWHARFKVVDSLLVDNSPGPESAHRSRLEYAQNAVYWQPRNVVYMGELINSRWHTLVTMAALDPALIKQEKWLNDARRLAAQAKQARWLATTYAKLQSTIAQIMIFVDEKPVAIQAAELSVRLSASDPTILFPAGVICAQAQDYDDAVKFFKSAIFCSSGRFFNRTKNFLVGELRRPDLLLASIPDNVVIAYKVYRELKAQPDQYEGLIAPLRRKCILLIKEFTNHKSNLVYIRYYRTLTEACYDEGLYQETAALLKADQSAFSIGDFNRLTMLTHYRLGNYQEALQSARVLVSLNPNNQANIDAILERIKEQQNPAAGVNPLAQPVSQPLPAQRLPTGP